MEALGTTKPLSFWLEYSFPVDHVIIASATIKLIFDRGNLVYRISYRTLNSEFVSIFNETAGREEIFRLKEEYELKLYLRNLNLVPKSQ